MDLKKFENKSGERQRKSRNMVKNCAVLNCVSKAVYPKDQEDLKEDKIGFHLFPKDLKLRSIWEDQIRRATKQNSINLNGYLCSLHFDLSEFNGENFNLRNRNCFPTRFQNFNGKWMKMERHENQFLDPLKTEIKQEVEEDLKFPKVEIFETNEAEKCRICLCENNFQMISIFNSDRNLVDLINFVAGIEILENDQLPQSICKKCLDKLEEAEKIKRQCLESDHQLKESLKAKLEMPEEVDENGEFQSFLDYDSDKDVREESTKPKRTVRKHRPHSKVPDASNCTRCKRKFANKYVAKAHLRKCLGKEIVNEARPATCYLCKKEFRDLKCLFKHMKENHMTDGAFRCTEPNCDRIPVILPKIFHYHLESHENPVNQTCTYPGCGKFFIDRLLYRHHVYCHNKDGNYICDFCGIEKFRKDRILKHIQTMHVKTKSFLCDRCCRGFFSHHQLRLHQIREHGATGKYQCGICGIYFLMLSSLKHHMRKHKDRPDYICKTCNERFKNSFDLNQHTEMVHIRKMDQFFKHQCPICFKYFAKSWYMSQHMDYHNKEFQCPICNHKSAKKFMLKRHMLMHSDEKTYPCPYFNECDKMFKDQGTTRKHMKRVHKIQDPCKDLIKKTHLEFVAKKQKMKSA